MPLNPTTSLHDSLSSLLHFIILHLFFTLGPGSHLPALLPTTLLHFSKAPPSTSQICSLLHFFTLYFFFSLVPASHLPALLPT